MTEIVVPSLVPQRATFGRQGRRWSTRRCSVRRASFPGTRERCGRSVSERLATSTRSGPRPGRPRASVTYPASSCTRWASGGLCASTSPPATPPSYAEALELPYPRCCCKLVSSTCSVAWGNVASMPPVVDAVLVDVGFACCKSATTLESALCRSEGSMQRNCPLLDPPTAAGNGSASGSYHENLLGIISVSSL
jgi:hypothetical protein